MVIKNDSDLRGCCNRTDHLRSSVYHVVAFATTILGVILASSGKYHPMKVFLWQHSVIKYVVYGVYWR